MIRALLSIHDVMPETRKEVTQLLKLIFKHVPATQANNITLLIVPGRLWSDEDLLWLKQLEKEGHPLAGHGWSHCAGDKRNFYHKLHSAVLSRNAAEHLSKNRAELFSMLNKGSSWFSTNALPTPTLYVPPAWAPGKLSRKDLQTLGYKQLETLRFIENIESGNKVPLQLCGYEADTKLRALFLKQFNAYNKFRALFFDNYLRVAIHPHDHQLLLAKQMLTDLQMIDIFVDYESLY